MSDLIKREDAINAVIEWYGCDPKDLEYFKKIVEKLPSAEPEQRWIPCTPDTMPETTNDVLTTYIVNGNKKKRYVETATWYPDDVSGRWSSPWDEYRVLGTRIDVIAWMPLPEPYKAEDE